MTTIMFPADVGPVEPPEDIALFAVWRLIRHRGRLLTPGVLAALTDEVNRDAREHGLPPGYEITLHVDQDGELGGVLHVPEEE